MLGGPVELLPLSIENCAHGIEKLLLKLKEVKLLHSELNLLYYSERSIWTAYQQLLRNLIDNSYR